MEIPFLLTLMVPLFDTKPPSLRSMPSLRVPVALTRPWLTTVQAWVLGPKIASPVPALTYPVEVIVSGESYVPEVESVMPVLIVLLIVDMDPPNGPLATARSLLKTNTARPILAIPPLLA